MDPCPILTPCQGALKGGHCVSKEHRPVCECPEGTIANSAGDVCIAVNGTETGEGEEKKEGKRTEEGGDGEARVWKGEGREGNERERG